MTLYIVKFNHVTDSVKLLFYNGEWYCKYYGLVKKKKMSEHEIHILDRVRTFSEKGHVMWHNNCINLYILLFQSLLKPNEPILTKLGWIWVILVL